MQLTTTEQETGQLTPENLALALRVFRDTGYVQIDGVYSRPYIERLRLACEAQIEAHLAQKGGLAEYNKNAFGKNHIGMFPPLVPPFSDPEIVANPIVVQLLEPLLAPDFHCSFYHTNTAYPGSEYQPVHRDSGPLFGSEMTVPHPPVQIVLNVPLCDFTEENGSTEVWPGTHLIVDARPEDRRELEARIAYLPSVRTNMPAGSLILRDLRMWHRGVPNRSDHPRAMLAIVYQRDWNVATPIAIPEATWKEWPERARQIFRKNRVEAAATPSDRSER